MEDRNHYTYPKADIQLWGKGYRISGDSQEFQRYLPRDSADLKGLEHKTSAMPWSSLLESLYSLREADVSAQKCVLLDASQLLSVSFAKTEDRHRRPSMVLTTCCTDIDWRDPHLGEVTAHSVALSSRLAITYADILRGNPDSVGKQLREGSFLKSRSFELSNEKPDETWDWARVISAVTRWSGISGVSTPRLLSLGANIVLSTKFEAERAKQHFEIDGFFDSRDHNIKAFSDRLRLWQPETETPAQFSEEHHPVSLSPSDGPFASRPAIQQSPELYWVAQCLQQLTISVDRLVDVAAGILERIPPDKRKR